MRRLSLQIFNNYENQLEATVKKLEANPAWRSQRLPKTLKGGLF